LKKRSKTIVFAGKHILLGVTGGIAAYKAPLLVRELVKAGAEVQVVMTPAAKEFVTPLTLAVLSRREVIVEMFPASAEQATAEWTRHIELALWADVMMVAPASANTLAKLAHGLADNFLTTLVLALRCPLVLAPTMDVDMYRHEATQATIALLRERGCVIVEPAEGELASGLTGPGRLPEVEVLLSQIALVLTSAHRDLQGRRVLVTAGPTHEPIDPVRYVGNRSSGKMGFAVARAAA
jgi:phosphopantothenoylcysteine decarboxylase/phosphopantothenate--cysteine ligase